MANIIRKWERKSRKIEKKIAQEAAKSLEEWDKKIFETFWKRAHKKKS